MQIDDPYALTRLCSVANIASLRILYIHFVELKNLLRELNATNNNETKLSKTYYLLRE